MKLIILYGVLSKKKSEKNQNLIEGRCSCMYREYAEKYGCIVYLQPQEVKKPWEYSIFDADNCVSFLSKYPDAIVWSVKHDESKRKILDKIKNRTIYYSCNNKNSICDYVDYSLVDTPEREQGNGVLWTKGKNSDFWKPLNLKKQYDYCIVGRRADKNEHYILETLSKGVSKRRVLWIGGAAHRRDLSGKVEVDYTSFVGPDKVVKYMNLCKVGVLFSTHPTEGYPQSHLEMSLCGLPVIYHGPKNITYHGKNNVYYVEREDLFSSMEAVLNVWSEDLSMKCVCDAVERYSIEVSWGKIKSLFCEE